MAQYRYLFADLLTNRVLAELPLTGVNFTQQLNSAGTFKGHLLLSGLNTYKQNVSNATIPGRTAVYVDRGGALVWGGVLWGRTYDSEAQTLTLDAREFESYFEKRFIANTVVFNNVDQLIIAQSIINTAQTATNGNIGIAVGSETSGVLVSRTFYSYELKTVMTALQDLAFSNTGFDFNVYVYYDVNGNPAKLLRLGYPRYGRKNVVGSIATPVVELPANIIKYVYPEDGTTAANTVYVTGAGSNEGKLVATAQDATKIAAGWPLLELSTNYSDINDATLLGGLASGQVAVVSYPPTTMQIAIPASTDPIFGSYEIGDDFRVRITDDRFPTGLDTIQRLVAYNVEVGENGPERVTITLTASSV